MSAPGVDVNEASSAEIQETCGVDGATANIIVRARAGEPFRSFDDVMALPGVGEAAVRRMRERGCWCSRRG